MSLVCLFATAAGAAEPVVIAEGVGDQAPKQPQAVITTDGQVQLVYGVGGAMVYHCQSTDHGKSFSPPKLAFQAPNISLGMRRGPRIAATGGHLVVTVVSGAKGKGQDGDVLAWRSSNAGQSWQGPSRVNDVPDSAREGLHAMAAGDDGTVWCVWLDLRAKQTELYASLSTNGGETWSKNLLVYQSPDGRICECCHPSIVVQGNSVHVLFRNSIGGNRDMYVVSSLDGKTFGVAQRLGSDHWKLNACPMDGGMLSVNDRGVMSTVWRRDRTIFATNKDHSTEISLGNGEQPWLAATAQGPVAVWTKSREGELLTSPLSAIQPRSLAALARDPVIVAAPHGQGFAVVCWESRREKRATVEAVVLDGQ
jgi:hypothetical protein